MRLANKRKRLRWAINTDIGQRKIGKRCCGQTNEIFASQTGTFVRRRANANMLEEYSTPPVKDGGVLVTPCERHLMRVNILLQQDNDPKHSSKLCKNYLGKKQSAGYCVYNGVASAVTRSQPCSSVVGTA